MNYKFSGSSGIYSIAKETGAATYVAPTNTSNGLAHHGNFNPETDKYWGLGNYPPLNPKFIEIVNILTGATEGTLPTVDNLHTIAFVTGSVVVPPAFTVTPSAGAGGSIDPAAPQTVEGNASASFTITPDTGYHILDVTGCDGTLVGNTYTTGPVTADCTVNATFAIDTFTVTPVASFGGTISPAVPQTIDYNATATFTVTPNLYYLLGSVSGCGGTLSGSTYTTGPITADCMVTASFVSWPTAGTPSSLSASPRYPSRTDFVNLKWGVSATSGVTYELERSVYGGSFVKVYQGPLTSFREKVYTLPKGQIVYRVRAIKAIHLPSPWRSASAIVVR